MRTSRVWQLTSILLLLVVAPLSPAMAWHCDDHPEPGEMSPGEDCPEAAVHRCAGLWSSACCDFSAPARPTKDVPGGFGFHARGTPVPVAELAFALSLPPLADSTLDLLVEDRAGPPPAPLLTSVLLI